MPRGGGGEGNPYPYNGLYREALLKLRGTFFRPQAYL